MENSKARAAANRPATGEPNAHRFESATACLAAAWTAYVLDPLSGRSQEQRLSRVFSTRPRHSRLEYTPVSVSFDRVRPDGWE